MSGYSSSYRAVADATLMQLVHRKGISAVCSVAGSLPVLIVLMLLGQAIPAFSQSTELRKAQPRLWNPRDHVCILAYNPNHVPLVLPEPFTPPGLNKFGLSAGGWRDQLKIQSRAGAVQPFRVVVGDNVTFVVSYADTAGEGFNDPTLGSQRQAAFEFAMGIWASVLQGPATIKVSATMSPRGGGKTFALLASGSPASYYIDFAGAPFPATWYPKSLVQVIRGSDPDTSYADIMIDFNGDVDTPQVLGNISFYYGTDGQAGNNVDFVTVAVHEMGHGLGFLSSIDSLGYYGSGIDPPYPYPFDHYVGDADGNILFTSPASWQKVINNNVFWTGPFAKYAYDFTFNTAQGVPLFAPTPYQPGSSISHLDEATFSFGTWDLMTPLNSLTTHSPDPIVLGILQQMGYSLSNSRYVAPNQSGPADGSILHPFGTLADAVGAVPNQGSVRLLEGMYAGPTLLAKPLTLHSLGGKALITSGAGPSPKAVQTHSANNER
jgi:hypothetical protein